MRDRRTDGHQVSLLASSKAEGRDTRVKTGKVVVVVGYSDGFVLLAVGVGVADEGGLPMLFDR